MYVYESLTLARGLCCREGRVLSVVEPREQFVINKLAQRLGVQISEVDISHGRVEPARRQRTPERREKKATP